VVFRSQGAPYTYIFSFRGTYSMLDVFEDAGFLGTRVLRALSGFPSPEAKVAHGFWSIYSTQL
jgi:hypothetical protein